MDNKPLWFKKNGYMKKTYEKTAIDILHEKKQSCKFIGQPISRWITSCTHPYSKSKICFKICDNYEEN